jgi:uncharacterized damage-inducible protein DinB
MTDLRYPIGNFTTKPELTEAERTVLIDQIALAPGKLRDAVVGLTSSQLDTPYRPGGWTVRQVIHHVADSHINAYIRLRLALTESEPLIKPYEEARWAELKDAHTFPIDVSLNLLESLHQRWTGLMRSLPASDFNRTFRHPEMGRLNLNQLLGLYSWHGRHHTAHVTSLKERMGWA